MERRIELVEKQISELDQTLGALISAIPQLDNENTSLKTRSPSSDKVWECQGCGARLGIYNQEQDELRVRYKDFLIYVTPGSGGVTKIPCRRCGNMNLIADDRENKK